MSEALFRARDDFRLYLAASFLLGGFAAYAGAAEALLFAWWVLGPGTPLGSQFLAPVLWFAAWSVVSLGLLKIWFPTATLFAAVEEAHDE